MDIHTSGDEASLTPPKGPSSFRSKFPDWLMFHDVIRPYMVITYKRRAREAAKHAGTVHHRHK
jgi:hypothetical protein